MDSGMSAEAVSPAASSGPLLIRAPVTSPEEGDLPVVSSPFSDEEECFLSGEEDADFEDVSKRPFVAGGDGVPSALLQKVSSMPKAPVSGEDDDATEELFDDILVDDDDDVVASAAADDDGEAVGGRPSVEKQRDAGEVENFRVAESAPDSNGNGEALELEKEVTPKEAGVTGLDGTSLEGSEPREDQAVQAPSTGLPAPADPPEDVPEKVEANHEETSLDDSEEDETNKESKLQEDLVIPAPSSELHVLADLLLSENNHGETQPGGSEGDETIKESKLQGDLVIPAPSTELPVLREGEANHGETLPGGSEGDETSKESKLQEDLVIPAPSAELPVLPEGEANHGETLPEDSEGDETGKDGKLQEDLVIPAPSTELPVFPEAETSREETLASDTVGDEASKERKLPEDLVIPAPSTGLSLPADLLEDLPLQPETKHEETLPEAPMADEVRKESIPHEHLEVLAAKSSAPLGSADGDADFLDAAAAALVQHSGEEELVGLGSGTEDAAMKPWSDLGVADGQEDDVKPPRSEAEEEKPIDTAVAVKLLPDVEESKVTAEEGESHEHQPSEIEENGEYTGEKEDFDSSETRERVVEVKMNEQLEIVDSVGSDALQKKDGEVEFEQDSVTIPHDLKDEDPKLDAHEGVLPLIGGISPSPLATNDSDNESDSQASMVSNNDAPEGSVPESDPIEEDSEASDDGEPGGINEASEYDEDVKLGESGKFVVLGSSEATDRIMKQLDNGSLGATNVSESTQEYSDGVDGQIVSYSDEDDSDEEDDGKELFDSAALTALLKAASGASSNGDITFTGPDGTRIFSVDRPAGLGSSIPSLKPAAPRTNRSNIFSPSDLAVAPEQEDAVDEEEKKLKENVDRIKVKFLRLVHRLGHSPEDRVVEQVLYRLSLAEGIRRGRQIGRAFSLENAKKKALQLEDEGKEPLDFSCNILLLGKTGVGKSATVNSIFGEQKVSTSAFDPATTSVREITGIVGGVKVRVIDTPGLRPSVMDQAANKRILESIKKHTKRCPPDIVLYVDRLDTQAWDFNDLPLLRSIAASMGPSIWFNAIVALTHAASAPPDGSSGNPLSYEVFVDQRSRVVQHAIRQAAGDMRLMNPVALVENHPSCRRNREGQPVLPNGLSWRTQLLLLCYSSKILSEANHILKLQDPSPSKLFGFRTRSPPLPFLLSSLLQSKAHPKLATDQGLDNGDSDFDLDDLSEADREEEEGEEDEYDRLPPFKPLRKAQIAKLTREQRRAYYDEYDYRVKLLQKKQWKEELRRAKEMKKRQKEGQDFSSFDDMAGDYDQDGAPATIPVPLPDMVLPPTFDCDNPAYRYRFLEPTSQLLSRPVLDSHGWDHDCGYDGVSLEDNLAIAGKFPAGISAQITKDKKEFNIHLDSSISAKHGETGSTLAGFDIQSVGKQLAYVLRSETKFKNLRRNKTAAGVSVTFLGENVATGLKVEDELMIGKRLGLVASAGTVRAQGDAAYGANLEVRLRDKEFPIGQDLSTLGLSLMRWRGDLALGANLQSQFSVGRGTKMATRVGLNNKRSGQITIRINSSEQLQIALMGILPVVASVYRSIFSEESG